MRERSHVPSPSRSYRRPSRRTVDRRPRGGSGQFTADNSATLTVGSPTPVFTATGPTAYTSTFPFSKVIGAGAGAIQVAVTNNEAFTGMVLRGTIAVRCPKELLTD